MAAASGLVLVPAERRNPLIATTRGTGELLLAAIAAGARRVIVGIGGSATNDGGAGLGQALGFRLLDADGRDLEPGGGSWAAWPASIPPAADRELDGVEVAVACDVTNPLCGPQRASAVYGPQKGAIAGDDRGARRQPRPLRGDRRARPGRRDHGPARLGRRRRTGRRPGRVRRRHSSSRASTWSSRPSSWPSGSTAPTSA